MNQLWIVGSPGAAIGQARVLLDGAMRAAGIAAYQVRFGTAQQAQLAKPLVTLALGDAALQALVPGLPQEGIRALRGYLWDTPSGRVLGTVCPTDILTDWAPWRPLLDLDMRRAKAELDAGAPPLTTRNVTVVTQPVQLDTLCAMPISSWLSVDIENTHDFQLACVGFAPNANDAWVVPAVEGWQMNAIRALCETPLPKVLQNGQYDRFFLKHFCNIELRNQRFDTQLAWHALNPELAGKKTEVGYKKAKSRRTAKSLKFLASIYLRVPYWKSYDFADENERYVLCGRDVCNTLEIAEKMAVQMEAA